MTSQLLANALISASAVFILASGFSLIYRVTKCFHFAHAAVFTLGAYASFVFRQVLGVPLPGSLCLAVGATALLGAVMELCLYRPLRHKGSSFLCIILASLGAYVVLQNLISLFFGDGIKTIGSPTVREGVILWGARMTPPQIGTCAVAVSALVALVLVLRKTRIGNTVRAVACDAELARSMGIDTDRIATWAFMLGSALAGLAGVLAALDTGMFPAMGMNPFLLAVVAVFIGGVGSIPGIAVGALMVAVLQHVGASRYGAQWQDVIAFVILVGFLLVRPEGIFGKKLRKATV